MEFKNKDLVVCDGRKFCDDRFCPWKHPRFAGHSDSANDEWGLCTKTILGNNITLRIVKTNNKILACSKLEFVTIKKTKYDAYAKFPQQRTAAFETMSFDCNRGPVSDTSSATVTRTSSSTEGEEYEITWR